MEAFLAPINYFSPKTKTSPKTQHHQVVGTLRHIDVNRICTNVAPDEQDVKKNKSFVTIMTFGFNKKKIKQQNNAYFECLHDISLSGFTWSSLAFLSRSLQKTFCARSLQLTDIKQRQSHQHQYLFFPLLCCHLFT